MVFGFNRRRLDLLHHLFKLNIVNTVFRQIAHLIVEIDLKGVDNLTRNNRIKLSLQRLYHGLVRILLPQVQQLNELTELVLESRLQRLHLFYLIGEVGVEWLRLVNHLLE